jgi:hypothetical protein
VTAKPELAVAGSAKGGLFLPLLSDEPKLKVIAWLPWVAVGVAVTNVDHSLSPELLVAETLNS